MKFWSNRRPPVAAKPAAAARLPSDRRPGDAPTELSRLRQECKTVDAVRQASGIGGAWDLRGDLVLEWPCLLLELEPVSDDGTHLGLVVCRDLVAAAACVEALGRAFGKDVSTDLVSAVQHAGGVERPVDLRFWVPAAVAAQQSLAGHGRIVSTAIADAGVDALFAHDLHVAYQIRAAVAGPMSERSALDADQLGGRLWLDQPLLAGLGAIVPVAAEMRSAFTTTSVSPIFLPPDQAARYLRRQPADGVELTTGKATHLIPGVPKARQ